MTDAKNIDEKIAQASEETPFSQKSEMGEVMENLDDESKLNKNTRLERFEVDNILIIEELIEQGLLSDIKLSDKFKQLKISEQGKGREEKVRIIAGEREMKSGGTFGERFKNLFRRQE